MVIVVHNVVAGRKARVLVAVLAMAIVVEVETLRNLLTYDVICLFSMMYIVDSVYISHNTIFIILCYHLQWMISSTMVATAVYPQSSNHSLI